MIATTRPRRRQLTDRQREYRWSPARTANQISPLSGRCSDDSSHVFALLALFDASPDRLAQSSLPQIPDPALSTSTS